MPAQDREFDIVLWGASGFTGKLTAEYLLREYGASQVAGAESKGHDTEGAADASRVDAPLRWALGGRNPAKLEAVRKELATAAGIAAESLPLVVGDSNDAHFLQALAERTRVVCTTVGPYAQYGSKLVAACAAAGTDYCDLTGEAAWMQAMIDAHQDAAMASGARIVFTCGFDCIPSDLGAFFMQREMQRRHGLPCAEIQLGVKAFKGAASGGTIASMLTMLEQAEAVPAVARAMHEPYSLNPKGQRSGPDSAEAVTPRFDSDFGQWTAPFVMAGINTKVVRRSNALLDFAYGRDFRYSEAMLMGEGPVGFIKATTMAAGSAAMMGAMSVGALRRAVSGRLPQPGDGPTKSQREAGFFDLILRATADDGTVLRGRVRGDRDPGYGSTSKMLGESAVCLARDDLFVGAGLSTSGDVPAGGGLPTGGGLSTGGGLWTPASAMGEALLARMPKAGVTFEIEA